MSELLAGAKIALPNEVNTILDLLKLGQQAMFGLFITTIVINFILLLSTPLVLRSRVWSLPMAIVACISGILLTGAAALATIFVFGAKYALTKQAELNIRAEAGIPMFVLMWMSVGLTDLAFLLHAAMGCFCHIRKEETDEAIEGETDEATEGETKEDTTSPSSPSSPVSGEKKSKMAFFRRRIKAPGLS